MLLFVGLGNPGDKYADNRHNVGFMAVDEIVDRHGGFSPWKSGFQGQVSEGRLGAVKVLALKPSTFMNESGRAVREALDFYKLSPADVIVLYDELDLAPGKVKVREGGGHAGHNGIRSLISHLGPDFVRVRIGIGHPGAKHLVSNYVLSDFSKADWAWVDPLCEAIGDCAGRLVERDWPRFMTDLALKRPDVAGDIEKTDKKVD